jgi:hypothetical protein
MSLLQNRRGRSRRRWAPSTIHGYATTRDRDCAKPRIISAPSPHTNHHFRRFCDPELQHQQPDTSTQSRCRPISRKPGNTEVMCPLYVAESHYILCQYLMSFLGTRSCWQAQEAPRRVSLLKLSTMSVTHILVQSRSCRWSAPPQDEHG